MTLSRRHATDLTLNLEKILQMGSRNKNYGTHIHRILKIVAVL